MQLKMRDSTNVDDCIIWSDDWLAICGQDTKEGSKDNSTAPAPVSEAAAASSSVSASSHDVGFLVFFGRLAFITQ